MTLKSSLGNLADFQNIRENLKRTDGRNNQEPRPIQITTNYTMHAEGSVLVETGNTQVICTASVEHGVPSFLRGSDNRPISGWIKAEYGMLPRSTGKRKKRDLSSNAVDGRKEEIQRLIGRSLRSIVKMEYFKDRTIWLDCDVIQADGGTRTASITGAFVALVLALRHLHSKQPFRKPPIEQHLAALSVGIVNDTPMLDLKYDEDSLAQVDMNVVMLEDGNLIEVQGTAEGKPFSRELLNTMLEYTEKGIQQHFEAQKQALDGYLVFKK